MNELETIELIIDESALKDGIDAISLVEYPAIEEDFVALNQHQVMFKSINDEKRIVVGLALVPDKKILRNGKNGFYNITFSKDTVRVASELYLKRLHNNNATLEHKESTDGVSVIESWIVEDVKMDKGNLYNLNLVNGAWVVKMKIDNDEVWSDVKAGKYLGFSIEGYFSEKEDEVDYENIEELAKIYEIDDVLDAYLGVELKSYSDYPKDSEVNAKRALEYKKQNELASVEDFVWTQAEKIANREPISRSAVATMASLKKHETSKDSSYSEDLNKLVTDALGGSECVKWALNKIKEIEHNGKTSK